MWTRLEYYFISYSSFYITDRVTSLKTMNTLEVLQIRRPRGSSIDVHVSLTRSMPRITVDDFLFFFFFSLPVLLWEPCSSVRGKNNDEKIVGIKYLKSWGVLRTVVRKNETVLHDVERIGMVEVHGGEQGNFWHLSHYYFVRYNSYAMYGVESSNFLLISMKQTGDSFFSPA